MTRFLTQQALADLADVPAVSRWVRSGGLRLHALDYGGDGEPLVVVPGITSSAMSMDFVARHLTDLVRPIVLDTRGRGLSDSADTYSLADYANDTVAVIAALGLDRPLLMGHSMGARIAAVTATKTALRKVIVVDPPMSGPGRGPYPTPLAAFRKQLDQAALGMDADAVAASWPRWPRREQELRARWLSSCGRDAVTASHESFEADDFFDIWPSVPAPAVLLYGADSPVVTTEGAREAAAANPDAEVVEIPDAGHMVFWDNPSGALALLRAVLG